MTRPVETLSNGMRGFPPVAPTLVLCFFVFVLHTSLAPAQQRSGWMDVKDSPAKHAGPWQKIKDSADQAKLRRELAGKGKLVFSSNRDGNWEIYVTNADGSAQTNLTKNRAWDIRPRWTPDGKQIVFFSDRDSKVKLSQIYDQLLQGPPTGNWTFFRFRSGERPRDLEKGAMPHCGVYIMNADGSNLRLLVKEARHANLSPDGKFLCFERKGKTITRNLETGKEFDGVRRYFGGSWWPEFSPDGRRVLVATAGDTVGRSPSPLTLMATIFDLKSNMRPTGTYHNVIAGSMHLSPRWRLDGKAIVAVQGSRELWLQAVDLDEKPNKQGWRRGRKIGLAKPADRYLHAFPAYGPGGRHIAFSLSPVHYLVRDRIAKLGYKPWKDGNQIIWQELCVGRAEPGKDNVWIQLTDGGYANRDADWYWKR